MVLLLLLSYIKYQLFDYPQMSARHKIFGINTLREKKKLETVFPSSSYGLKFRCSGKAKQIC